MPNALIVEDDVTVRNAVAEVVAQCGFEPLTASSLAEANRIIEDQPVDVALLDLQLPDGNGMELLARLDDLPRVDVVVITGRATVDVTVEAFRSGVVDLMTKPVDPRRLRDFLTQARKSAELSVQVRRLRNELRQLGRFGPMIGASSKMQAVYDLITKVAPTDSTVLVTGETGTGKELVARTVHELSKRADGPFLPINCGAVQPTLIESELFGHEKGSFTGADRRRQGLFERACGGTLFLDEITEMPGELQVKLLRVLEAGEFQRVGGDEMLKADARIIAATNRDPQQALRDRALREDLMYRLLVFPIHLPPLREREDDVLLLADHFVERKNRENETDNRLSARFRKELPQRHWAGNVRELHNVIDRAYIMAEDGVIQAPDAPEPSAGIQQHRPPYNSNTVDVHVGQSIAEAEKRLILATLEHVKEKKKTAEMLGISVKTLYTRLNQYGAS